MEDFNNWEVHLKPVEENYTGKLFAGHVVKKYTGTKQQMKNFCGQQIKTGIYKAAKFIRII